MGVALETGRQEVAVEESVDPQLGTPRGCGFAVFEK